MLGVCICCVPVKTNTIMPNSRNRVTLSFLWLGITRSSYISCDSILPLQFFDNECQVLSSLESFNVGSFHGQPSPSVVNAGLAKIPGDPCDTDRRPTSSVILGMDAVTRASVLRGRIDALETASRLSRDECLWIFALSAAVDAPLDAEMSASLRSLLRKCASLRAGKSEPDDEVMMLNILVTVSGKFFGQSEN